MNNFEFCPRCGGKLVRKKIHGLSRQVCGECNFVFFRNPKPTVGVFIIESGKVLLAKRGTTPYLGWWDSIGGFMEEEETPQEAALRETKEETGLDVQLLQVVGVGKDIYEKQNITQHTVPIAFLAKITGGKMQPSDDVSDLKWFPLSNLPRKIAFESNKKLLSLLKQQYT
jgi:8-oxo-dGTP diphosphatase